MPIVSKKIGSSSWSGFFTKSFPYMFIQDFIRWWRCIWWDYSGGIVQFSDMSRLFPKMFRSFVFRQRICFLLAVSWTSAILALEKRGSYDIIEARRPRSLLTRPVHIETTILLNDYSNLGSAESMKLVCFTHESTSPFPKMIRSVCLLPFFEWIGRQCLLLFICSMCYHCHTVRCYDAYDQIVCDILIFETSNI